MKKSILYFFFLILVSCNHYGQLTLVSNLSKSLKEVSGNEIVINSNLIWMINDSGNKSEVYGVNQQGKIEKVVKVKAKNHDWEDLTSDELGNLYIGDFGNNNHKRKNLRILKIINSDLLNAKKVEIEKISFKYPQLNGGKKTAYDAESFFYLNGSFYIFTKSRLKKNYGKTLLFKIPATLGNHIAKYVSEYTTCKYASCRITSAAISPNKQKVVLLNHDSILMFTNFTTDNFFKGTLEKVGLGFASQKEGVCFKDNTTLFITDEKSNAKGRNLYQFTLKE